MMLKLKSDIEIRNVLLKFKNFFDWVFFISFSKVDLKYFGVFITHPSIPQFFITRFSSSLLIFACFYFSFKHQEIFQRVLKHQVPRCCYTIFLSWTLIASYVVANFTVSFSFFQSLHYLINHEWFITNVLCQTFFNC